MASERTVLGGPTSGEPTPLCLPRSRRPTSRVTATATARPAGRRRGRAARAAATGDGRTATPARPRCRPSSASALGLDLLAAARGRARPPARPARSPRSPCRSAARTTPTCGWCCSSASATAGRDDLRRAGAAVAGPRADRTAVATTIAAVEPDDGLEPFVVGAMLGSFGFSWRSHAARARARRPGRAGRARRRRPVAPSTGPSPSAAPAGAPARWPRSPRTSRPRRGSPSRPASWPTRPVSGRPSGTSRPARRGLRRHHRRRPGLGHPAPADPPRLHPGRGRSPHADRRAGRQGHHLRHRRALHQARRGHGRR